jgi:hypothetical protein
MYVNWFPCAVFITYTNICGFHRYTQYENVETLVDRKAWLANDNADCEAMAAVKMITQHVQLRIATDDSGRILGLLTKRMVYIIVNSRGQRLLMTVDLSFKVQLAPNES